MLNAEGVIARSKKAFGRKSMWTSIWKDCIDYAMPMRDSFYKQSIGSENMDRVYDETAIIATSEFCSIMQAGMMPSYSKWFGLTTAQTLTGSDERSMRIQLDAIGDILYESMEEAGLSSVTHEVWYDLAIGTGNISVNEKSDQINPLEFNISPITEYAMDQGPNQQPDGRFREIELKGSDIKIRWPDAKIPTNLAMKIEANPDTKVKLIEATYRDWSVLATETWIYQIVAVSEKEILYEKTEEGFGSEPWATGRWAKAGSEWWGRGPLVSALPAIRALNLTWEMMFENAQLAISGIWDYESNGIINAENIVIEPGTLIPREPGTQGLRGLQSPSRFDLSQIIMRDQQEKIKRALYNEDFGPVDQTPRSATEIAARQQRLHKLIGASYGRIQREISNKIVMRSLHINLKQGKIELPKLNGKTVRVIPASPLSRYAHQEDIQKVQDFLGMVSMVYGPQIAMMVSKIPETVTKLAQWTEFPQDMIASKEEIQQGMQALFQQAQQQGLTNAQAPADIQGAPTGP